MDSFSRIAAARMCLCTFRQSSAPAWNPSTKGSGSSSRWYRVGTAGRRLTTSRPSKADPGAEASEAGPSLETSDGIEGVLEDRRRGEGVERCGALAAAQTRLIRSLLGGESGQALVPQQHRQAERGIEPVRECAHRLTARPFAAVHVERPADHQPACITLADDLAQCCQVLLPAAPADRAKRRGEPPAGIGAGDADRPLADVERQQARPRAAAAEIDEHLEVV